MSKNFGSKRLVVGAQYGLRDWLAQRATAMVMALFTIVLLVQVLFGGPLGYDRLGRHLCRAVDEGPDLLP
jgi:succinate dehydrogenase / fumarate reductase membrane anchor subunit